MMFIFMALALFGMLHNIEGADVNVYCGTFDKYGYVVKESCGNCPVDVTENWSGSSKSYQYYCAGECSFKQVDTHIKNAYSYCGHDGPYFQIKADKNNQGNTVCKVKFSENVQSDKNNMVNHQKCTNNMGQSMRICHTTKGTKIKLYDNEDHEDDKNTTLEIKVKVDLQGKCATVPTFDDPDDTDDLDFIRTKKWHSNGKLNNRVSSFTITVG